MRTNFYRLLIITTIVFLFSSCFGKDEEIVYSSDPSFSSLKFAKNDSIPGLEKAVFTYEYDADLLDSVIVNLDSLPFLTRIDSVFPTFSFKSSAWSYLILRDSLGTGLDTVVVTGKDTVDFTRVLRIRNFAQDGEHDKMYNIKVNVHQVQPELYVWTNKLGAVYGHNDHVQKVLFFKDKFFYYAASETTNYLYTSPKALQWTALALKGLPLNCNFRDITAFNEQLFLVHEDGKIYSSADGVNWSANTPVNAGYTINKLFFVLDNNLWSVFKNQSTQQYHFSTSADGAIWEINEKIPTGFPLRDFGAFSFVSKNKIAKAIVVGGYDAEGALLSSVWSVQKNVVDKQYKWIDLSKGSTGALPPLAGTSIISYDEKLLLFGGMASDKSIITRPYKQSIDEGLTWKHTDTILNVIEDTVIPLVYEPRSYQSVVHDATGHYIYLFGGRNKDKVFSDVWVGKLNRLSFAR